MVTIEFFGVPRLRAGLARLGLVAGTVGDALVALADRCPALAGTVVDRGRVLPSFALSINGDRFVDDPSTPLTDGDTLILLSADVGG